MCAWLKTVTLMVKKELGRVFKEQKTEKKFVFELKLATKYFDMKNINGFDLISYTMNFDSPASILS